MHSIRAVEVQNEHTKDVNKDESLVARFEAANNCTYIRNDLWLLPLVLVLASLLMFAWGE